MTENGSRKRILIVDDAPDTLEVVERNLTSNGYDVVAARSVSEATRVLESVPIDLVITDYKMPQVDGLDLVQHVHDNFRDVEIVMITGYPTVGGAVRAVRLGAFDYIEKPFTDDELLGVVSRALTRLQERRAAVQSRTVETSGVFGLLGESEAMRQVCDAIDKAASTLASVIITGESGTGKELIARAIHYRSDRASYPFVAVNCGGIPEGLLESELFGHVKGAFTGAIRTRPGFFQAADGGTLFLDEISETSPGMQVKLLRVLQDGKVCKVGDSGQQQVDVRVLAATNKNLEGQVSKGKFREDLYFRLSVITIAVPPLRDREGDIVLLANAFAQKYARDLDRPVVRFSESAIRVLKNYYWSGNVRELENAVQRLTIMNDSAVIEAPDLPALMKHSLPKTAGLHRTLAEVEIEHIRSVLASVSGNKSKAAQILGIDRKTLREKIKSHGATEL